MLLFDGSSGRRNEEIIIDIVGQEDVLLRNIVYNVDAFIGSGAHT